MKQFKTLDDILQFAINAEQEAVDFYTQLAGLAKNPEMKAVFMDFAQEEVKHKTRLVSIRETKIYNLPEEKVKDLKIAEFLAEVPASPNMSYAEALVLAMKKEKNAFRLYMVLSAAAEDPEMKAFFLSLATEESKHKLQFEIEYDENILREN
jgi:rubrerythrin